METILSSTTTMDISSSETRMAGAFSGFFARISLDAQPGENEVIIHSLPLGTKCITVWMMEWSSPNNPHVGDAVFYTDSVQLFDNGTKCRVKYRLDYPMALPAAASIICG
ncbi:hypothetical protein [Sporocytophaga myxococcoides]|uniref:hypothetical protein n=1 Tax=Sporocytophaga myxococcoides TaxID=153721 RepID=UPI00048DEC73|nr:hypothetical protein [Sporocytophaga myxococcoides]